MILRINEFQFKTFLTIRYININMSDTTGDNTDCCKFCEYINEHRDIFKNKVLINRIHKCKIVDILTEKQYIDMYDKVIAETNLPFWFNVDDNALF